MQDLIVIGGGVVGLSVAWEAARRGLKVLVLERDRLGKSASWAGAGILPPPAGPGATHPLEVLGRRAWHLHAEWAELLPQASGIATGYRQCGGLYLSDRPGDAAALSAVAMAWEEEGWNFELLTDRQRRDRFPELEASAGIEKVLRSLWAPQESQLRNPRHLQALVAACRAAGVTLLERTEIDRLEQRAQGWSVRSAEGSWQADQVCVAGGAWTRSVIASLGIVVDIVPIRGQMALYQFDRPPFDYVMNVGPRYIVPRDDGHVLVGSTEEEAGFDISTTDEGLAGLREFALRWLPEAAQREPLRTWAGLRPSAVDGFPYIGLVPRADGLSLAAGHFRAGLTLSPATAEMLVDLITGKTPQIDPTPFSPARGWSGRTTSLLRGSGS